MAFFTSLRCCACLLLASCLPSDPADCPPPHPTFNLTVQAIDGPLPDDVTIAVRYGSGEEEFSAKQSSQSPKVVFCKLTYKDAPDTSLGPDSEEKEDQSIEAVVCELWTDGAATVTVKASGYPETEQELSAERDKCGIVLTDEEIMLERKD